MSRFTLLSASALLLSAGGCASLRPVPAELDAGHRLDQGLAAFAAEEYHEAFDHLAWVYARCPGHEVGLQAAVAMAALELDPRHPTGRPEVGSQLLASVILDPTTPAWVRTIAESTYLLGLGLGAPPGRRPSTARPGETPTETPAETPTETPTGTPTETPTGTPADSLARDPGLPPGDTVAEATEPEAVPVTPAARVVPSPNADEPDGERARACGPALPDAGPAPAALPTLPGPSLAAMLAEVEANRDAVESRAADMIDEITRLQRELGETRAELERIRRTLRP